ncbi:hypothetical protein GCM10007938_23260 [Vibrio zhanjiangensis]|uniref:Type-2Aa cytolytic delta-endotoxin n=1 Tax=Vibrio zhanjiangensis TaxID=1046128 RepID=A0ABQ6EZ98_9VIBR|nr:hypothetical protein [Vibrio zhanjiangensis]GLT18547.1 hypothetical protein GCM10007938_23260 [Vibrio zhanjiangensis]
MESITIAPHIKTEIFSPILNINLEHLDQAVNMLSAFDGLHASKQGIDFDQALTVAKEHKTMAVIGTKTISESAQTMQAWVAIDQLQNLIGMVQGAVTENWAAFGMAARAFLDLNAQKNGGYLVVFGQSSEEISYQYNMFNITQNESTGSTMVGQLTSVDIHLKSSDSNVLSLVAGSKVTQTMNFKSMVIAEALKR